MQKLHLLARKDVSKINKKISRNLGDWNLKMFRGEQVDILIISVQRELFTAAIK